MADEGAGVFHQQQEVKRVRRRRVEIEVFIEGSSIVVQGVHQQCADADDLSRLDGPGDGVAQEVSTQAIALLFAINRQPRKQDDRNRVCMLRRTLPETPADWIAAVERA